MLGITGQDGSYLAEFLLGKSDELGTPGKLLDFSRLARLGWTARTPLKEGLKQTYQWFVTSGAASEIAVKS